MSDAGREVTTVSTYMLWFVVAVVVFGAFEATARNAARGGYEGHILTLVVFPSLVILGMMRLLIWIYREWNR
jgi:Na+-driven multidrug efflux pump